MTKILCGGNFIESPRSFTKSSFLTTIHKRVFLFLNLEENSSVFFPEFFLEKIILKTLCPDVNLVRLLFFEIYNLKNSFLTTIHKRLFFGSKSAGKQYGIFSRIFS